MGKKPSKAKKEKKRFRVAGCVCFGRTRIQIIYIICICQNWIEYSNYNISKSNNVAEKKTSTLSSFQRESEWWKVFFFVCLLHLEMKLFGIQGQMAKTFQLIRQISMLRSVRFKQSNQQQWQSQCASHNDNDNDNHHHLHQPKRNRSMSKTIKLKVWMTFKVCDRLKCHRLFTLYWFVDGLSHTIVSRN